MSKHGPSVRAVDRVMPYPSKKQLEIMAAACCYAGFHEDQKETPLAYWRRVTNPEAREFYIKQARAIIDLVRAMPTVKP